MKEKARFLSAMDLALDDYFSRPPDLASDTELLPEADPVMSAILQALGDGYAGAILEGPPGTSKSLYAHRAALTLAEGHDERVRFVQFHPSYQYEDFMEGYVPSPSGQFKLTPKHFRALCEAAANQRDNTFVLVIDEISRCDAARVFGEALTYIEKSKRGLPFYLASGTHMAVPQNIVILATMNVWDRGVDEMDAALERRFAHIDMPPRADKLREILTRNGLAEDRIRGAVRFFEHAQQLPNPACHIGHAYFINASDEQSLQRVWDLQLRHHFAKACRGDPAEFGRLENMWKEVVGRPERAAAETAPITVEPADTTTS